MVVWCALEEDRVNPSRFSMALGGEWGSIPPKGHWDRSYLGETRRSRGCFSRRVPVAEEAERK